VSDSKSLSGTRAKGDERDLVPVQADVYEVFVVVTTREFHDIASGVRHFSD